MTYSQGVFICLMLLYIAYKITFKGGKESE